MSQCFSYNEFKQLNQKELDKLLLNLAGRNFIGENSSDGYILQVDLKYPDKLHKLHNDYPLAPEKLEISCNMLSNYCSSSSSSSITYKYDIKCWWC